MRTKIVNATLTAILAGSLTSVATNVLADSEKMLKGQEKCYGISKAGLNDCGTVANNNGCAGSSTVDGDKTAWLYLPKGTCNKIVGGSTKAPKA